MRSGAEDAAPSSSVDSLIISKLIYKVVAPVCVSPPTWILRSAGHQEAVC